MNKMKKLAALMMALGLLVSLAACGGAPAGSEQATPPDLTGVWQQINNNDETFYQKAQIQGDVIEIYWVDTSMGTETLSLYWSGTFTPPETGDKTYTWESQRDKDKTDMAILASTDDTKTFTYSKNQISYEVSVDGETATVKLEKLEGEGALLTDQTTADLQDVAGTDTEPEEEVVYGIGDTWTVAGLWSMTITGVEEVAERNQYADENPPVVYRVDYTYSNLGYESDIWDGLYMDLNDGSIVDSAGKVGRPYYYGDAVSPLETPVGATCEAQACVGLDNAGDFTIIFSQYDNDYNEYTATFKISATGEAGVTGDTGETTQTSGTEQTGGTVTLSGINVVLPDYATYAEVEAGTSGVIKLEGDMRRVSIVASDFSSFDESNYDTLNQMTIAAILQEYEYSNEEGYTVTVGGETAQAVLCNVTNEGVLQTWMVIVFIHEGTQYAFLYLESPGAAGDSADFVQILESVSYEA